MGLDYQIRQAVRADNKQLLSLVRQCPMQGHVQVYIDRFPDYFAMIQVQGECTLVYVAEDSSGNLIGSVVFIERMEFWAKDYVKVLHLADLRTAPASRRSGIAASFIQVYQQKLLTEGFHHGRVEIMDGNEVPILAQRLLGDKIKVEYGGHIKLYQLLPVWKYRPSKAFSYRRATSKDFPSLAKLLAENYKQSLGAPEFNGSYLEFMTGQHSSFTAENIWVAESKEGEILASLAVWDQVLLRRTILVRLSGLMRLVVRLLAGIGLIWTLPSPPKEGEALRYLYLRWPACIPGQNAALRALISLVMQTMRQQKSFQFAMLGFHDGDSLRQSLKGIFKVHNKIHLYFHMIESPHDQKSHDFNLENSVHYVDFTLV